MRAVLRDSGGGSDVVINISTGSPTGEWIPSGWTTTAARLCGVCTCLASLSCATSAATGRATVTSRDGDHAHEHDDYWRNSEGVLVCWSKDASLMLGARGVSDARLAERQVLASGWGGGGGRR